eukprot:COSAG06_NODE_58873_length_276_cov_0.412429_1_plen_61_part_01
MFAGVCRGGGRSRKRVTAENLSREGKEDVKAGEDKTGQVWCAETGECEQTLAGHSGWVNSA